MLLPLVAMTSRVDWASFGSLVTSPSSRDALWLSLRTCTASTVVCLVLGVPLAVVLARTEFAGRDLLRALVLVPLVLPPVVGGIALLYTFGRRGLLGHSLEVAGLEIAFSTTAVASGCSTSARCSSPTSAWPTTSPSAPAARACDRTRPGRPRGDGSPPWGSRTGPPPARPS
jgi:ABC-type sulfate transport system permease component